MTAHWVRNHSHWGAFFAKVEDGRVVGVRPFEHDPDPSVLIEAIPAGVHSPTRVTTPMVREGWRGAGTGKGTGSCRGRERFVPVAWGPALDLVAGEIARVKASHGNAAIMGGSQGWGSAGIFHAARGQLHRFLGACGGFVDQTTSYSFGTALAFLPHVIGSAQAVTGPLTSWSSISPLPADGGVRRRQSEEHPGGERRLRLPRHRRLAARARRGRGRGHQYQPGPRRRARGGAPGLD